LPRLRGYVLTYAKPRSDLLMKAGEDPLLVSWRHGLGRVVAFTSDLSGRWGREWVAWQGLPQWAGQLARDTMRRIVETSVRAEFHAEADAVRIVADLVGRDGRFVNHLKLYGNVTAPDRSTQRHALLQSAPGRYEGKFVPAGRGIHFVTIFAEGAGEAPSAVATVPYVARPSCRGNRGRNARSRKFCGGPETALHAVPGSSLPRPRELVGAGRLGAHPVSGRPGDAKLAVAKNSDQ
jgi:hypothetical protein